MKTGEVTRTFWYVISEGVFSFHTAFESYDAEGVVFMSPHNVWPSITAQQEGIKYVFMRNSTQEEIAQWLADHPSVQLKDMQEITVLVDEVMI